MKLSRIISNLASARVIETCPAAGQGGDPEIVAICYRSDQVSEGAMFVAIPGTHVDGHRFVGDAVARGAAAVMIDNRHQDPVPTGNDCVVVGVDDPRKALASVAARFYSHPSDRLYLMGITGTNGKTTTAYLIEGMLKRQGMDVGVISTINYRYQGRVFPNPLTTPESLDLQKILAEMAKAGVTHVVMEVSSHGVALDRIYDCRFDLGVFTNLTQDHLDFHGTMENYWDCKRRFFTDYLANSPKIRQAAVVNQNDAKGRELLKEISAMRMITVGTANGAAVTAETIVYSERGMTGTLVVSGNAIPFHSHLVGRYNLENILCAVGAGVAMEMPLEAIVTGIEAFGGVPGRLERIPSRSDRHIYIDYAHTPDALLNVLTTLREIISGRIICVFGCGGDRDRKKRPQMGQIAARFSDLAVITSDNPRTESPEAIINDIRPGTAAVMDREYTLGELAVGFEERGYAVAPDREQAIALAIRAARSGDAVLIAGKGHEDYQIIGRNTLHFDDREKALAALALVEKEEAA